jgi:hypothetical protein
MDFGRPKTAYVAHFGDLLSDEDGDSTAAVADGAVSSLWKQLSRHPETSAVSLEDDADPRALAAAVTSDVLRRRFPGYLACLSKAGKKVVVFLDGIDRVHDGDGVGASSEAFDWLPAKLPEVRCR